MLILRPKLPCVAECYAIMNLSAANHHINPDIKKVHEHTINLKVSHVVLRSQLVIEQDVKSAEPIPTQ